MESPLKGQILLHTDESIGWLIDILKDIDYGECRIVVVSGKVSRVESILKSRDFQAEKRIKEAKQK